MTWSITFHCYLVACISPPMVALQEQIKYSRHFALWASTFLFSFDTLKGIMIFLMHAVKIYCILHILERQYVKRHLIRGIQHVQACIKRYKYICRLEEFTQTRNLSTRRSNCECADCAVEPWPSASDSQQHRMNAHIHRRAHTLIASWGQLR